MNIESLQSNWALWLALASLLIAAIMVTPELLKKTSRSKLNRVLADMKKARKEFRKSARKAQKAERRARKLLARADRLKPRILREAKEAFEDGKALAKILHDKVIVAEAHVTRVIHDEFPPETHEEMREKHLPKIEKDLRPFSF